ncbi:MAG: ribosomal RNA small subunit methyltransferase A [bacterium]|nr:ribosomal RNA small subunit methyltransferase A [bacterium]
MKHHAKKEFGQNFLTNKSIVEKITHKANLQKQDFILEIGPGKGFMTDFLLAKSGGVLAIELDKDLIDFLKEKYQNEKKLILIQGDCLKMPWETTQISPNKLIANIPYNITSQIIFRMLKFYPQLELIILMMQEEVANRIIAKPHTKSYGILSVILHKFYKIEKLAKLSPGMFYPKPKVNSALLKFIPKQLKRENIYTSFTQEYINFVKFCFNERRKILFKRLIRAGFFIEKTLYLLYESNNIEIKARPENITPDQFWQMFGEYSCKEQ